MGAFTEMFNMIFKPVLLIVNFFVKFFKNLPKVIQLIVKTLIYFVTDFIPLMFKMLKNAGIAIQTMFYYISNPLKLFDVFVRIAVFIPIMICSILYHIPLQRGYKFGDMCFYVAMVPFVTAIFIWRLTTWFLYKLVFEYLILRPFDKMTNGSLSAFYYRTFIGIENPPDSWHTVPNYQFKNRNTRYLFAFNACPAGYKPNGVFCTRKKYYENDYCDQSKIYNMSEGDDVNMINRKLNQSSNSFMKLSTDDKEEIVSEYVDDIKTNLKACNKSMAQKASLIKSICMQKNHLTSTAIDGLCKNVLCKESYDPVCHKYVELKDESVEHSKISSNMEIAIKIIILLFVILLIGNKLQK